MLVQLPDVMRGTGSWDSDTGEAALCLGGNELAEQAGCRCGR